MFMVSKPVRRCIFEPPKQLCFFSSEPSNAQLEHFGKEEFVIIPLKPVEKADASFGNHGGKLKDVPHRRPRGGIDVFDDSFEEIERIPMRLLPSIRKASDEEVANDK
jgi:hypothetical protein